MSTDRASLVDLRNKMTSDVSVTTAVLYVCRNVLYYVTTFYAKKDQIWFNDFFNLLFFLLIHLFVRACVCACVHACVHVCVHFVCAYDKLLY